MLRLRVVAIVVVVLSVMNYSSVGRFVTRLTPVSNTTVNHGGIDFYAITKNDFSNPYRVPPAKWDCNVCPDAGTGTSDRGCRHCRDCDRYWQEYAKLAREGGVVRVVAFDYIAAACMVCVVCACGYLPWVVCKQS